MAKFKFRLATLRKIREATRDQRRAHLAEAYRADEILQQQSDQIEHELSDLREECRRASGPGPVDVDRLTQAHLHELVLRAHQQHLGRQREAVAAEIHLRREALVHANREVRVLEKLEEKQAARHQQQENRRQIKQLDEVARRRAAGEDAS
jgi:flagellar FliJ protein